jgi:hypothetical protein
MPYAEKTPKANAAIDAQISITKFNTSVIQSAFVDCVLAKATSLNIGNSELLFKKLVLCKLSIAQFVSVMGGSKSRTGKFSKGLELPH